MTQKTKSANHIEFLQKSSTKGTSSAICREAILLWDEKKNQEIIIGNSNKYLLLLKAKFFWAKNLRKCEIFNYLNKCMQNHIFSTKIVSIRAGKISGGKADLKKECVLKPTYQFF